MDGKKKDVVSTVKTVGAAIAGLCSSSVAIAAIKTIVSPKASLLGKISFFIGTSMISAVVADRCQKQFESLIDDTVAMEEKSESEDEPEVIIVEDETQD